MSFLDDLRNRLSRLQTQPVFLQSSLGNLEDQLEALTQKLKGHSAKAPADAIVNAVERFQKEPRFRHSHDALLVSLGCDRPIGKIRYRLIEDNTRFPAVLSGVDRFRKHRTIFRDCYKGLLDTYLGYHPDMKGASTTGRPNWEMLRSWLDSGASGLRDPDGLDENWVPELVAHPELFSEAPVDAFARQVLEGKDESFLHFQQALGIDRTSWLMEQVVLAQVRAAAKAGITPYIPKLLPLLEPLASQNPVVFNQGLAEVLGAYCEHSGGPLHGALRDFSLYFWGNPLFLRKESSTGWISVPRESREMVKKWFKLHVIQQFFNVLAKQDQHEEDNIQLKRERRRDFWEKYADVVGDVKFALGPNTRSSDDPRMVEVIKLMEGMTLDLYGAGDGQNNAFIMRFDDWVVAEFGHENNACFVYRASDVPFENGDTSISAQAIRHHIQATSSRRLGPEKLYHRDRGGYSWEDIFEDALRSRGIVAPVASPASKTSRTTWKPEVPTQAAKQQVQTRTAGNSFASSQAPATPVASGSAAVKVTPRQSATSQSTAAQTAAGQTAAGQTASAWRNPSILRPPTGATSSSAPAEPATSTSASNSPIVHLPFGAKQEKELLNLCRKHDIYVRDMREREGYLWVALDKPEDNRMTPLLQAYGFKYRPGRGWWRQA
ncbi:EH_Signature domain-containing protein [Burkholderia sp. WP9]|uniref:EH signature domain-containing protein n=1 Tax=Burkholderia sp. WP9 TaxID=1500263 RepID=UPI000897E495|nr:EH signature domain-containing protein [Burkholderia sp. WP9]SEB98763.1 EH_Signature domain-containing protein [Burkholderia sp. WP9]